MTLEEELARADQITPQEVYARLQQTLARNGFQAHCPLCRKTVNYHYQYKIWFHYPNTNPKCGGPGELPAPNVQTTETTETTVVEPV